MRARIHSVVVLGALGALVALGLLVVPASRVEASPIPPTIGVGSYLPAIGPAEVDSFTVSCGTSATLIQAAGGQFAYTCQNVSTTIVGVGDADLADPDSGTRDSPVYCATNCPSQEWNGHARKEYCRADTGTVTIYCRALVAAAP